MQNIFWMCIEKRRRSWATPTFFTSAPGGACFQSKKRADIKY